MTRLRTTNCKRARFPVTASGGQSDGSQHMRPWHGRTTGPTRRSTTGKWTAEEDEVLRRAVEHYKGKSWKKIAAYFKDRTDVQCLHRWQKVLNPELVKGPWSKEEDQMIIELVNRYGAKKWSTIAEALPGRIGKQCRERWHNHLNPAINKEPWTQEEEMALIRAHQIYGNKWAELQKFLPGRTDNAIKNHWNSSVKKKLESYLASGLLEQFQGLPYVEHPSSLSVGMQQSQVDGVEEAETSECSRGSLAVNCFQFDSGTADAMENVRSEESDHRKGHNMEQYLLQTAEAPDIKDCQYSSHKLPNVFVDVSQESPGFVGTSEQGKCENESHNKGCIQTQTSAGLNTSATIENMLVGSAKMDNLLSESDLLDITLSEARSLECVFHGNVTEQSNDLDGATTMINCQSDSQSSATTRTFALESCAPLKDVVGGISGFEAIPISSDDFIYVDSLGIDADEKDNCMKLDEAKNAPKLVPVDIFSTVNSDSVRTFSSNDENAKLSNSDEAKVTSKLAPGDVLGLVNSDSMQALPSMDDDARVNTVEQDSGALSYRPLRFPGFDVPFLNVDLITSGVDMQQAYSPFGIRQLLMHPMNFASPRSLWDSPIHKSTPDAISDKAAKSFTCTTSIMKRRLQEPLSPVEETKGDKEHEKDTNMRTFSLTSTFSSLESLLEENGVSAMSICSIDSPVDQKVDFEDSMQDKANTDRAFEEEKESIGNLESRISEKDIGITNSPEKIVKKGAMSINPKSKIDDGTSVLIPTGVLVERNIDEQLVFSPNRDEHQTTRALSMAVLSPRGQYVIRLDAKAYRGGNLEPSSLKNENFVAVASTECAPSSQPPETTSGNAGDDADIFSMSEETPNRKRGIESPSAWKSPLFVNTFLPGPRFDMDMTFEDLGYFLSPGMRSYDAIGLMRQLNEDTATVFANAWDGLAGDDPVTPSKIVFSGDQHLSGEDNCFLHNEQENIPPGDLAEQCVPDFSGCGTPGKGTDKKFLEHTGATSFSTPSSYLTKNCR
ncbi:transcription factor MYB3R-1-like isoform X2 [Juglans microcarpa x Juglans regia]|uniref:transcription factor MYB3R-1-like isoform X2 n=1 Tax=Juglans microcarpa x Juglans regia TaxID=2249226 RepID=UPI001B7EB06A|nr:transcription factor MYB3R-1-like isoform X2 [Juglans microcarpa x Juglans regia]